MNTYYQLGAVILSNKLYTLNKLTPLMKYKYMLNYLHMIGLHANPYVKNPINLIGKALHRERTLYSYLPRNRYIDI